MKIEYTKEKLEDVVKNSNTYRQVLLVFNRNQSSRSYKCLKDKLKEFDINTEHFLTPSEYTKLMYVEGNLNKKNNLDIFVENSSTSRSCVKKRIIDENLIDYKCFKCGNDGEWMGNKISLILDHINGVNNDHRLENLRFLCPNCNATLKTHCVGSKGLQEKPKKVDGRRLKKGTSRPEIRKVVWPSKKELISLLDVSNYCAIGRTYGVSDTTVREWAKKYNII
jgi:predicted RNA-binding Zn-ribbon protein involved in translation (DUF1610 family)